MSESPTKKKNRTDPPSLKAGGAVVLLLYLLAMNTTGTTVSVFIAVGTALTRLQLKVSINL